MVVQTVKMMRGNVIMRKIHSLRTVSAAALLSIPMVLSGCGMFGAQSSEAVDPPPPIQEAAMIQAAEGNGALAMLPLTTVYLQDQQGLLAPVSLTLPSGTDASSPKTALDTLVTGGAYAGMLPEGFQGVLPQGTVVQNVTIHADDKLAVVEFSGNFAKYDAKEERKMLEAVTWTLTGTPDVENVQIWVDGKKLTQMPVNSTPLPEPLNRAVGINLDLGDTFVTNSSPVTVYFSAASPAGIQYYVPVTRLVTPGEDRVQAALNELIKGPDKGGELEEVMTGGTELQSVKTAEDGTVTVALKDDMFAEGDIVPSELLQSVVLTTAENTASKDAKVQIEWNGQKRSWVTTTGITVRRFPSLNISTKFRFNEQGMLKDAFNRTLW